MIERSQTNAEKGVEVTQGVSDRLHSIHESVTQVDTLVKENAAAGKEQAQGIEQVNTAVSEMDRMVQQLSAIVTGDTFNANGHLRR